MKTTFKKITETQKTCPLCQGEKKAWYKEYHNQLKEYDCLQCKGTGAITQTQTTDITNKIPKIIQKLF